MSREHHPLVPEGSKLQRGLQPGPAAIKFLGRERSFHDPFHGADSLNDGTTESGWSIIPRRVFPLTAGEVIRAIKEHRLDDLIAELDRRDLVVLARCDGKGLRIERE